MAKKDNARQLITHTDPKSIVAEAFRTLRTNLYYTNLDKKLHKIMVTSAGPGEGKSTIISNLAVAQAQTGQKVLLIDADLRKPVQHKIFQLDNRTGLTTMLVNNNPIDKVATKFGSDNLYILPSGPIPPNPSELLGSEKMDNFLKTLDDYDIVYIDAPPVIAVTDALVLAPKIDGVILAINSRQVTIEVAQKSKESLERVGANLLGVVLNNVKYQGDDYQYYYYYGDAK